MNTADRSVEALDTALRRRFSFINMPPNPSVIKKDGTTTGILNIGTSKIDLIELLTIINKRIEILLDGDHLIGHSYFMGVDNIGGLKLAFSKQIIPLLQEYFYGDYGKISLVLGEGFCTGEKTSDISNVFASSTDYETDVFAEKVIYELKDLNKISDEDFIGSINTLLNKIEKVEDSE